ncbi:hypothetical protein ISS40_06060 [Candidatus Bathyarchaeota archaeon]|nr:hypothetical protein [Candidatus Bathyarchaeota archaeon]
MSGREFHRNVLNGKDLITEILDAVEKGKLTEPFYPDDIKRAVPGWANQTYHVFPWKHCLQNPDCETTALFYSMDRNVPRPRNPPYRQRKYRLLRKTDNS